MENNEIWYLWSPWLKATNSPWEEVLHLGVKKRFKKNSIILGNGQPVNDLFYLHTGEIKLSSVNSNGEEKPVWYISRGNIFGEVPYFDKAHCYSIFTSVTDSVVYLFNRQVLTKTIIPQYPDIVLNIFNTMASKMRILASQVNDLSLNSPKMRVYKMIYSLVSDPINNVIYSSQQELANLLSIHRVTLNRILVDLKNSGIIQEDISKKRITLINAEELLKLIEAEQV
ncbi:Crp/Fnr family transcriptional regulator [Desulfosporosinus nitroreducens]|uniref:Crp/Fnr family transcriptional regulator n=1 Tax=Desulfosporosinus nitroreducens TaxID=2018668 RepID=A0ABT8QN16_9FIRM|nr:Crp/Fnr family transcriptional regulator [Desulfosporosinus nitroreducens]MDO0822732.1 Crp/Fnr family transcriptional regulator [Desulfosporosinus nitroreducens]